MNSLTAIVNQIEQEIEKSYQFALDDPNSKAFYDGCAYGLSLARKIIVRELMDYSFEGQDDCHEKHAGSWSESVVV